MILLLASMLCIKKQKSSNLISLYRIRKHFESDKECFLFCSLMTMNTPQAAPGVP